MATYADAPHEDCPVMDALVKELQRADRIEPSVDGVPFAEEFYAGARSALNIVYFVATGKEWGGAEEIEGPRWSVEDGGLPE